MTDGAGFRIGGVVFPLTSATTNTLLRDADPALYFALDYFAAMMTTHLGARFAAEVARTPAIANLPTLVKQKFPYDPSPWLKDEQLGFPLLSIYRKNAKGTYKSTALSHDVSRWGIEYILPPITPGQAERILPLLGALPKVIGSTAEQGWNPSYTPPGGTLAGLVWSAAYASIESIELNEWSWGAHPGTGDLFFPAWVGELTVTEIRQSLPATDPNAPVKFTGADVDAQVKGSSTDTAPIDGVVRIATDVTPPKPGP